MTPNQNRPRCTRPGCGDTYGSHLVRDSENLSGPPVEVNCGGDYDPATGKDRECSCPAYLAPPKKTPKFAKPKNGIPCLYDPPIKTHHLVEGICVECSKVHAFHAGIAVITDRIALEAPR